MNPVLKALAEAVCYVVAAIGILNFILQVISDGRVRLIHAFLTKILGGRG
jgi:hypothetical protein